MQHAAQTYGAVANKTANPRELEADLLLSAAAKLQTIRDGWDSKSAELDAALLYNRKLWSIFVTSATSPENPLPVAVRQNVANIALFVFKQTLRVLADPKPENLGTLINTNAHWCQIRNWYRNLSNRP
jgi:flagellar protein FlaF